MRKVMPPPVLLIRSWRRRYVRSRGPRITSVDSLGLTDSRYLVADAIRREPDTATTQRPHRAAGSSIAIRERKRALVTMPSRGS
jgi:hypothetical protein